MRSFCVLAALLLIIPASAALAQELTPDTTVTMKARVTEVLSQKTDILPGTGVTQTIQTIRAKILNGPETGNDVTIENDFLELRAGDVFYLNHTTSALDGTDYYSPVERDRTLPLALLCALFIATVILFGGKQGIRGLLSLAASFAFIGAMLAGIMHGYPPVAVALGAASVIVLIGSYMTHGVNRTTSAAVIGMIATIALTGALAYFSIHITALTGWNSDEATYLNLNSRGSLDLAGILLGGILIGLLGVLYDAAIGQAVSVEELVRAAAHYTRRDVYQRALRIGREHIGALVNTLAIAYVGASLPLLLLFFGSGDVNVGLTLNREIFATEIVRILVGSIGLVLAVPVTTAIAVSMLHNRVNTASHGHSHLV